MRGKFKFQDDFIYKMPAHFGGSPFYPIRAVYGDMLGISVQYETDQDALLQYIPEDFELREPVVSVQYTNCRDVVWMSGGEYRPVSYTHLDVYKRQSIHCSYWIKGRSSKMSRHFVNKIVLKLKFSSHVPPPLKMIFLL